MSAQFKSAVSVAEMARMIGMSRSRFYQLIGTAFPPPSRDEKKRPYYTEEQQAVCADVRRRNCGVDGKPILFYPARSGSPVSSAKRPAKPKQQAPTNQYAEIVAGVQGLGLVTVTATQVGEVIQKLYPAGTDGVDPGKIIRAVFLSIKRQDSADNVG